MTETALSQQPALRPGEVFHTIAEPSDWLVVLHRLDGYEWAITQWQGVNITETFEGVTVEMTLPASDPTTEWLTSLTNDLLLYRENVFLYRVRIVDIGDTFTADDHMVTVTAVDYAQLLRRRVLFHDKHYVGDQFTIAWNLVTYTQGFQSLGITQGTTGTARGEPGPAASTRSDDPRRDQRDGPQRTRASTTGLIST